VFVAQVIDVDSGNHVDCRECFEYPGRGGVRPEGYDYGDVLHCFEHNRVSIEFRDRDGLYYPAQIANDGRRLEVQLGSRGKSGWGYHPGTYQAGIKFCVPGERRPTPEFVELSLDEHMRVVEVVLDRYGDSSESVWSAVIPEIVVYFGKGGGDDGQDDETRQDAAPNVGAVNAGGATALADDSREAGARDQEMKDLPDGASPDRILIELEAPPGGEDLLFVVTSVFRTSGGLVVATTNTEDRVDGGADISVPVSRCGSGFARDDWCVLTSSGAQVALSDISSFRVQARTASDGPAWAGYSCWVDFRDRQFVYQATLDERMIQPTVGVHIEGGAEVTGLLEDLPSENVTWRAWAVPTAEDPPSRGIELGSVRPGMQLSADDVGTINLEDYGAIIVEGWGGTLSAALLSEGLLDVDVPVAPEVYTLSVRDLSYGEPIGDVHLARWPYTSDQSGQLEIPFVEHGGNRFFPIEESTWELSHPDYLGKKTSLPPEGNRGTIALTPEQVSRRLDVYIGPRRQQSGGPRDRVIFRIASPSGAAPSMPGAREDALGFFASGASGDDLVLPFGTRIDKTVLDERFGARCEVSKVDWGRGGEARWGTNGDPVVVYVEGREVSTDVRYVIDDGAVPNGTDAPRLGSVTTELSDGTSGMDVRYSVDPIGRGGSGLIHLSGLRTTSETVTLDFPVQRGIEPIDPVTLDVDLIESDSSEGASGLSVSGDITLRRRHEGVVVLVDATEDMFDVWDGVSRSVATAVERLQAVGHTKVLVRVAQGTDYEDASPDDLRAWLDSYSVGSVSTPQPRSNVREASRDVAEFNQDLWASANPLRNRVIYVVPNTPYMSLPWREGEEPFSDDDMVDLFVVEVGIPKVEGGSCRSVAKEFFEPGYDFAESEDALADAIERFATTGR
jgi:hypothetical protein